MAFAATATQAELVTLHTTAAQLEILTRQYADGSATPTKVGRFTEAEVQAGIDAVQAAAAAVEV